TAAVIGQAPDPAAARRCAGSAGNGEAAFSVSVDSALPGGDFQGMRVYRPMTRYWSSVCSAREEPPALLDIGSMSPPDYPSAWLHPCSARFRFIWCQSLKLLIQSTPYFSTRLFRACRK